MSIARQQVAYRKARRQGEYQLTCAVAEYLDRALPESARFTHIPNGEKRDARTGAKLKRMGVRKGWPDFVVIHGDKTTIEPVSIFIELKTSSGLSQSQREFADWCERIGQSYYICKSIDDVKDALTLHSVPLRAR